MRGTPPEQPDEDAVDGEIIDLEVVDGSLVLATPRSPVVRPVPAGVALAQTAAVAATGFVAGVATAAVLGRRRQRRLPGPRPASLPGPPAPPSLPAGGQRAVSRRTYLVDVQLIERHLP
jgi:hypothetical protein